MLLLVTDTTPNHILPHSPAYKTCRDEKIGCDAVASYILRGTNIGPTRSINDRGNSLMKQCREFAFNPLTPTNFCPNLKTHCDMTLCRPLRSGPWKWLAGGTGIGGASENTVFCDSHHQSGQIDESRGTTLCTSQYVSLSQTIFPLTKATQHIYAVSKRGETLFTVPLVRVSLAIAAAAVAVAA